MFFEKLVEQHRVHCVVAHRVDLAVLVAHHQVRVHLGYFLGDQSKFGPVCGIALVMESHRLERQEEFTGRVRQFNLLLEPARGTDRAELTRGVDHYVDGVVVCCCHPANVADKAGADQVRTYVAYSNNVSAEGDSRAGARAQRRVANAGIISECGSADGRVEGAGGVANEGIKTDGCVVVADGIESEGIKTDSRVVIAGSVAKERSITVGRVAAGAVAIEGSITVGRVVVAANVVGE